jgi:tetratricopeptide (TPR) repeat protein
VADRIIPRCKIELINLRYNEAERKIMKSKYVLAFFIAGLMASGCGYIYNNEANGKSLPAVESAAGEPVGDIPQTVAGTYLASHYAQNQNDWKQATRLLDQILQTDPDNKELIRQSMVLAAGAGYHDLAAERAAKLVTQEPGDSLANLILATHALADKKYNESLKALAALPGSDMSDFVVPLLEGWSNAGLSNYKVDKLTGSTIHSWHAALIALYLNRSPDDIYKYAQTMLSPTGLTAEEVERAADLMAVSGHQQDAVNIYKALQSQKGGSVLLAQKIDISEKKGDIKPLVPAFNITSPAQGAALAIFDLARVLYQEKSDVSARVFAEMVLGLDPTLVGARLLIASSYGRSGQIDEALAQYRKIPENDPAYLESQHASAELLYESGRMDDAVALLKNLYETRKDPDSMIRIGDLYRSKEDFRKALEIYNSVAATLPDPLPGKYWYLLYSRGMAYERLGEWNRAEADLKAALAYQPENPYLMNYLAYGWADQGIHLEEALKMLEQAASLKPGDGYITDSLGWVNYMNGRYEDAVPNLEDAVQLMPYDPTINEHLGDAYWRVGRKVEARFQWERAKNYSRDNAEIESLTRKLADGLDPLTPAKRAESQVNQNSVNR